MIKNPESPNNTSKPTAETQWSELEQLGEDGFQGKNELADDSIMAPHRHNKEQEAQRLKQSRQEIEQFFNEDDLESTPAPIKAPPTKPLSRIQKLSNQYVIRERRRIEDYKTRLKYGGKQIEERFEQEQVSSVPGTTRRVFRSMMDRAGLKIPGSNRRREREAMYAALTEYHQEQEIREAEERAREEEKKREAAERERRQAEGERRKARAERENLERAMASARNQFEARKISRLEHERAQEALERDLNSRLLKVENLENEALFGNPEVQKRSVSFEGQDILVYDLKGFPFATLTTTIDYRSINDGAQASLYRIGNNTYKEVMKNPAIWAETREEAERSNGWGTRNADARGNTICTSYRNSEHNLSSSVSGDLIYGFESVGADSVVEIRNGDGGTGNMEGDNQTQISGRQINFIDTLEGADGTSGYNEILLRRYDESGNPKKPDYIVVENGRITEAALRHAKFFGIPIVNIEKAVYEERAERRGEELLDSISEDDSYEELDGKLAELLSIPKYKESYVTLDQIGRGPSSDDSRLGSPTPLKERCFEISKMERIKRLDFLRGALEEAVKEVESATGKGAPAPRVPPRFDSFNIQYIPAKDKPGDFNRIEIDFKLKGSSRSVETSVYDGERMVRPNEALDVGVRKKEEIEGADSSYYDMLEPIVRKYFEAYRKNQELENH